MDLGRYVRVAWRFRLLLGIGLVVASAAALLSVARVSSDGISYREGETWVSASTVLVTQDGFPYGRAILDDVVAIDGGGPEKTLVPKFGDASRYSGLAALYAELAKGDSVSRRVMAKARPGEYYHSEVVKDPQSGAALPLVYLKGYGATPEAAARVAELASKSFREYLGSEQAKSDIPPEKRVEVVVTQRASSPEIFLGRSFVRPIFLFALIAMAFLGVAFGLENLRPRTAPEPGWSDDDLDTAAWSDHDVEQLEELSGQERSEREHTQGQTPGTRVA